MRTIGPAEHVAALATPEFQALADSIPQLLWITLPDGAVAYINQRWRAYAGIEEMQGAAGALHPADAVVSREQWERIRESGEIFERQYRVRAADGTYRWHLARAAPHYVDGDIVCWLGSATDVHDQRLQDEEFQTMFELAGSGKTMCDIVTGRILRANAEMANITGYSIDELYRLTIADLTHPDDRHADEEALQSLRTATRAAYALEKRYLRRDGSVRWVEVQVSAIPAPPGELASRTLATTIDITTRRRSEQRYLSLVTASASIVWSTDATGAMVEPQSGWEAYSGQSWEQHRGFGWLEMIHPDDRNGMRPESIARLSSREATTSTGRIWNAARQTYRHCVARRVPMIEPDGSVSEWIGTTTDVDEQRRAELANAFLVRADPILGSSLATDTIIDSLSLLVTEAIGEWCIVDLSDSTGQLNRATIAHRDSAMQPHLHALRALPAPARDVAPALYDTIDRGMPLVCAAVPDARVAALRADSSTAAYAELGLGSYVLLPLRASRGTIGVLSLMSGIPHQFSEGDTPYLMELARRAALAIENARLYEAAQAANEAKDAFLANLSHELRTPMTAILGWASLLATGEYDETMLRTGLIAIRQSAQNQTRLIEDLLDLSAAAAGKLVLTPESCTLREIVERAVRAAEIAAHARNIAMLVTCGDEPTPILADEDRMQQAVGNVLSNAIKFTPRGGEVRVMVSVDGDDALLRVRDSGSGIDPAFLDRIFDRFTQEAAAQESSQRGLGLGLSIVRQIIELHGGSIVASSEGHGCGAEFALRIPRQRGIEATETLPEQDAWKLPSLEHVRVLIVEDDPGTRAFIGATLQRCGAVPTAVDSAERARAALAAETFDLLLSDIALPGGDGIALVAAVRGGECGRPDLPTLAVTAFGYGQDRERIVTAGFDDYLCKPVNPVELAHKIASMMGSQ